MVEMAESAPDGTVRLRAGRQVAQQVVAVLVETVVRAQAADAAFSEPAITTTAEGTLPLRDSLEPQERPVRPERLVQQELTLPDISLRADKAVTGPPEPVVVVEVVVVAVAAVSKAGTTRPVVAVAVAVQEVVAERAEPEEPEAVVRLPFLLGTTGQVVK